MWNLAYRANHSPRASGEPIRISTQFTHKVIAAWIETEHEKTWHRAGYLTQVVSIPAIGNTVFGGEATKLEFQPQIVEFPTNEGTSYELQLSPVPWLRSFTFSVWEFTEDEFMPVYGNGEIAAQLIQIQLKLSEIQEMLGQQP